MRTRREMIAGLSGTAIALMLAGTGCSPKADETSGTTPAPGKTDAGKGTATTGKPIFCRDRHGCRGSR